MAGIGVFGGTFDPIHVGHLVTAVNVRYELGLAKVLLVVAKDPWQKAGSVVAPAAERLAMVVAAVGDVPGLEADGTELEREGPTFTADTLGTLSRRHPGAELFLILGSDAAALLPTWERVEEVRALATVVIVQRPGAEAVAPPPGWRARSVDVPHLEVSSTELRARLADGRPLDWLMPEPAVRLARAHGLYGLPT